MRSGLTFRQIEKQEQGTHVAGVEPSSSLDVWYGSVRDKTICDFSEEDLCISCRQGLYPTYVVPEAIERLEHNPLAGEKYDGELIVALKFIPVTYWDTNNLQAKKLKRILLSIQNHLEPELVADVSVLLTKLDCY